MLAQWRSRNSTHFEAGCLQSRPCHKEWWTCAPELQEHVECSVFHDSTNHTRMMMPEFDDSNYTVSENISQENQCNGWRGARRSRHGNTRAAKTTSSIWAAITGHHHSDHQESHHQPTSPCRARSNRWRSYDQY